MTLFGAFTWNDHGIWCNACGEIQVPSWDIDDDTEEPEQCCVCGWPDEFDPVAAGFVDEDELTQ